MGTAPCACAVVVYSSDTNQIFHLLETGLRTAATSCAVNSPAICFCSCCCRTWTCSWSCLTCWSEAILLFTGSWIFIFCLRFDFCCLSWSCRSYLFCKSCLLEIELYAFQFCHELGYSWKCDDTGCQRFQFQALTFGDPWSNRLCWRLMKPLMASLISWTQMGSATILASASSYLLWTYHGQLELWSKIPLFSSCWACLSFEE